jgi:CHAD domain-containing protein
VVKKRSAILDKPAPQAARLVAVALIDETLDRWQALRSDDADPGSVSSAAGDLQLHAFRVAARRLRTWLKLHDDLLGPAISPVLRKRLSRAMRATNADRDAQVHRQWLDRLTARPRLPQAVRRGITLLQAQADDDGRNPAPKPSLAIGGRPARLDKTLRKMRKRLRPKTAAAPAAAPESGARFAAALAARASVALLTLRGELAQVHSEHDEPAAHQARLTAKLLRYLLDPIRKRTTGGATVQRLAKLLQDDLGKLHDLQTLRSRVEQAMQHAGAAYAAARAAHVTGEGNTTDVPAAFADLRSLEALLRRVMSAKRRRFALIAKRWLHPDAPKRAALVDAGEALVAKLTPPPPPEVPPEASPEASSDAPPGYSPLAPDSAGPEVGSATKGPGPSPASGSPRKDTNPHHP